jgi:hypothetical protein
MTDLSPDVQALLDKSYKSDLTEEESEELLLLCGHGIGPKLSPAADAVLDAYMNNCGWLDGPLEKDYRCAAAVLRAAADQLTPYSVEDVPGAAFCRNKILAIANELEGNND